MIKFIIGDNNSCISHDIDPKFLRELEIFNLQLLFEKSDDLVDILGRFSLEVLKKSISSTWPSLKSVR